MTGYWWRRAARFGPGKWSLKRTEFCDEAAFAWADFTLESRNVIRICRPSGGSIEEKVPAGSGNHLGNGTVALQIPEHGRNGIAGSLAGPQSGPLRQLAV
jgi:hypothetical protein